LLKREIERAAFSVPAPKQGEDADTDNAAFGQEGKRDGFGDSISTSLTYENKDVGVALALAGNFGVEGKYNGIGAVSSLIKAKEIAPVALPSTKLYSDAIRVTGSYDFSKIGANGLVLGALYQQAEPTDDIKGFEGLEEKAWLISSTYKVGMDSKQGGLQGALDKLKGQGLTSQVDDWVSTGPGENAHVGAEQVQSLFDDADVAQVAQQTQAPKQDIYNAISAVLPQIIDSLTPQGEQNSKQEANDDIQQVMNLVSGFLKR